MRQRRAKRAQSVTVSEEHLLAAAYTNSFRTVDRCVESTGLRTKEPLLRDACLRSSETLAEVVLYNSKFLRNDRETDSA